MKSALRRVLALTAATTTVVAGAMTQVASAVTSQFGQQEVNQSSFIAVAAPYRNGDAHQLLILEQVGTSRECWNESGSTPTVINPLLLNFDFTGICGRSTDSNGYSIRMNGQDLGLQYSLRTVHRDGDIVLVGTPRDRNNPELVIGHANGMTTDFAKLSLEPGWRFTKRTYQGQSLGHIYLTYDGSSPINPNPNTPNPGNSAFRDIANDIYRQEIEQAVAMGFIAGFYEDNTFRPQESLTREQLVSMVLEGLKKVPGANLNIPTSVSSTAFRDVDASRWSAAKIQFAQQTGIVTGYEDGSFRPAQPVTRAELIAVMRKAALYAQQMQGKTPQIEQEQTPVAFSDINAHWASQTITEMSGFCGIASPMNETGTAFFPNSAAQRNYAAAATFRMLTCVGVQPATPAQQASAQ